MNHMELFSTTAKLVPFVRPCMHHNYGGIQKVIHANIACGL